MSEWQFWQDAMAGKKPVAHEGDVHTGYFRTRRYDPVAFWTHGDKKVCLKAGKAVTDPHDMADLFMQVSALPISYELYSAVSAGAPWPHDPTPVDPTASTNTLPANLARVIERQDEEPENPRAKIGSNNPPDEFTLHKEDIERWIETAKEKIGTGAPKTQLEANTYGNIANKLQELETQSNALYVTAKAPHEKALTEVRQRWLPLINSLEATKKSIKEQVGKFLAAERERLAVATATVALPEGVTVVAEKPKAGTVRGITEREIRRAEIVDYEAALAHFADHDEVKALIQKLANQLAASAAKIAAPGCRIILTRTAA